MFVGDPIPGSPCPRCRVTALSGDLCPQHFPLTVKQGIGPDGWGNPQSSAKRLQKVNLRVDFHLFVVLRFAQE